MAANQSDDVRIPPAGLEWTLSNETPYYEVNDARELLEVLKDGKTPFVLAPNIYRLPDEFSAETDDEAYILAYLLRRKSSLLEAPLSTLSLKGAKVVAEALKTNSSVRELLVSTLQGLPGAGIDDGLQPILRVLSQTKIDSVSFSCGGGVTLSLLKTFESLPLRKIQLLIQTLLGGEEVQALINVINHNKSLKELDLRYMLLGDESTKAVMAALESNRHLESFELTQAGLGDVGAEAVAQMLTHNNSLRHLAIPMNKIGRRGLFAILNGVRGNSSLSSLDLTRNQGKWDESNECLYAKGVNTHLKKLMLGSSQGNRIGTSTLVHLMPMLLSFPALEELDLSNSDLGKMPNSIQRVSYLSQLTHLKRLYLADCKLKDNTVAAVAEVLRRSSTLQTLYISSNRFGQKGAIAIAEALKASTSITSLSLDSVRQPILECLSQVRSLRKLHIEVELEEQEATLIKNYILANPNITDVLPHGNRDILYWPYFRTKSLLDMCCKELLKVVPLETLKGVLISDLYERCCYNQPFIFKYISIPDAD